MTQVDEPRAKFRIEWDNRFRSYYWYRRDCVKTAWKLEGYAWTYWRARFAVWRESRRKPSWNEYYV